SAPHVAGAAALVLAKNPTWDASQIQNFLEQRASSGSPTNPPANTFGHGVLTLGDPTTANTLPTPAGDHQLASPINFFDTRKALGTSLARPMNQGEAVTVTLPTQIPASATAAVIYLGGSGAQGLTYLSAYAGHIAFPNTSNVNLTTQDATATV